MSTRSKFTSCSELLEVLDQSDQNCLNCADQEKVQALMDSIQEIGLKEPVMTLPSFL